MICSLDCPTTDVYDGAVIAGALVVGHLELDCFPEIIRVVKPGKKIIHK